MAGGDLGTARGTVIIDSDMSGLDKGEESVSKFGKKTQDATLSANAALSRTSATAALAGGAIEGGFLLAIKTASDFQTELSGIQAVSGATASQMDLINAAALRIGKDTAFSASEAASAMSELAKAGISIPDILNGAADATVALAAAGGVQLPEAATIAANAMNQFKLSAKDMPKVADTIAGAANASAIDVSQFGYSLSQVGAVAKLAGATFQDTSVAIALMGNAGIVGSDAGTSLKSMLQRLNPQTQQASDLMKQLGIITADGANQFYTAQGSLKSMADVSQVLQNALSGMTDQQKQATLTVLFGQDAIRGAAILAQNGADGFDKMAASMGKVSAADVAKTRLDNMNGSMEQLRGSMETLSIEVGQAIIPALTNMINGLTNAFNWFQSLPGPIKLIIGSAAALAGGLLLAFAAITKTVQSAIALKEALTILKETQLAMAIASKAQAIAAGIATAAQWAWNAALTANPIGIIIVAIAAIVAALIWFFTQTDLGKQIWSGFISWLQSAWQAVAGFFTGLWNGIVSVVTAVWNGIMAVIGAVVTWFTTWVINPIAAGINFVIAVFQALFAANQAIWNAIMAVVGVVVNWFMTWVWPVFQAFGALLAALFNFVWQTIVFVWNSIMAFIMPIVQGIVDFVVNTWNLMVAGISIVLNAIWGFITSVWNAIVGFLSPIIDSIVNFVVAGWNLMMNAISTVLNAIWGFISSVWNNIVGFLTPIVQGIFNTISSVFNNIKNAISNAMNGAWTGIQAAWNLIVNFFSGMGEKIIGFFAGAGEWLINVGKQIIGGLIKGIQNALGGLKDVLNFVTGLIPKNKGPESVDKVLLYDNGELIMKGLINGLHSQVGHLKGFLGDLTTTIPATLNADINNQFLGAQAGTGGGDRTLIYQAAPGSGQLDGEDDLFSAMRRAKVVVPGW